MKVVVLLAFAVAVLGRLGTRVDVHAGRKEGSLTKLLDIFEDELAGFSFNRRKFAHLHAPRDNSDYPGYNYYAHQDCSLKHELGHMTKNNVYRHKWNCRNWCSRQKAHGKKAPVACEFNMGKKLCTAIWGNIKAGGTASGYQCWIKKVETK